MSAARELHPTPSRSETLPPWPNKENVKQPESIDTQIQHLTKKHKAIEQKVGQLRLVMDEYILDDVSDPVERAAEAEQKRILEADIAAASAEWKMVGQELAALMSRKELSSAWDEPANDNISGLPEIQVPSWEEQTLHQNPEGPEADPWQGEHTEEALIPKERMRERLLEKKAELVAAQDALKATNAQLAKEQAALEGERVSVERAYASVAVEKDQFERSRPIYRSSLIRLDLSNKELAERKISPLPIKRLKDESVAIEKELRNGPPKRGVIGFLKGYLSGEPSWEERVKKLRTRDDELDEAIREYAASERQAKQQRGSYAEQLKDLEGKRTALETNANPTYARYSALRTQQEQITKNIRELSAIVKNVEEALGEY